MPRPLRIEYEGAVYHILSRGNIGMNIYCGEDDYALFIRLFTKYAVQQSILCYAYCLMPNHYHLLLETPQANLSKFMQLLNGTFTQKINERYERHGHIFQGRYKYILVQKEQYLMRLVRYIEENPLNAGLINDLSLWKWSSYNGVLNQYMCAKGVLFNNRLLCNNAEEIVADIRLNDRMSILGDEAFKKKIKNMVKKKRGQTPGV